MAASQVILVAIIGLALPSVILCKPPNKIVNGTDAAISNYPGVVAIQFYGGHWCGGALISRRHVLTAAHCLADFEKGPIRLHDKNQMSVVSGTSYSSQPKYISGIEKMEIHPGFTGYLPDFLHDIGIITLAHDINIDETQNVVGLPSSDVRVGTYAMALGWGYLAHNLKVNSEVLQKAPVITLNNHECNQRAPTPIFKDQFCASDHEHGRICHGDSGGPLISNNQVIGVISMTWKCGGGYPDVYTRVYSYLPWIHNIIWRS